ncbi:MAG TPA: S1 RNA-binding domain-containing protein [Anaerolineae bacterium]|nr:S1 RNA-binding domain-containing protein [Anaerolineae bacterium]
MDVGSKRDAVVPRREVDKLNDEQLDNLRVGDQLPIYVLRTPVGDEQLLVSIDRGLELEDWQRAKSYLSSEELLELKVTGQNRGGLTVKFGKIRGFVPNTHIPDLGQGAKPRDFESVKREKIGTKIYLKVIEADRKRRRLVLSGRAVEKEIRQQRLQALKPGQVVQGRVVHLVEFGAFVDLGGVDGLIHISELEWHHVNHPSEVVDKGDEIEVMVKEVDVDRERISLSRKALLPSPWDIVKRKYQVGDLVEGKVTNVRQFGAFVMFPEGIEGLIHESEMGIIGPGYPQDVVASGDHVQVQVVDIDLYRKRMSLRLKKVMHDEQVAPIQENHDNDEDVETGAIKELSLLGSVYETHSQDLTKK